jgi:aspartyl-tRNA(Asn)/glutamyl-tRNA(Gln) amidotransferase subunit B
MDYQPTIGLEIHAELKTRTKMFCDSLNDPNEERPNVNVCPVCLGHPGTLPTINKQAVEAVIKAGLALGGAVNPVTKFDRKNYFYPDLPKGYQISQYDQPIVLGGKLQDVRIRRIHLEEDAGRLLHMANGKEHIVDAESDASRSKFHASSLVDFNRAGVPLMELVTEPDIRSSEEAVAFAKELQLILRYLGISDAEMEKGQMRIEANISLNMGTKVEVKNINSFKAVHDAIEYEIKRQMEAIEASEKIVQETRGWDDVKRTTVSQRGKEEAHDYRYFPEPDLPPFETAVFDIEDLRRHLPELPDQKRVRFMREYGFSDALNVPGVLIENKEVADYFEKAVSESDEWWDSVEPAEKRDKYQILTPENEKEEREIRVNQTLNYLTSDLVGLLNEKGISWPEMRVTPENFGELIVLIREGKIMSRQAKDILRRMVETGSDPEEILEAEGLHTVSDEDELSRVVGEVIAENLQAVADYKKGKEVSLQFMIGKAMGKLKGKGHPEMLKSLFEKSLTG